MRQILPPWPTSGRCMVAAAIWHCSSGAGRTTRDLLPGDPPSPDAVREARRHVRAMIAAELRPLAKAGTPDRAVGTSKTMRSLARICGAAPSDEGPLVSRVLSKDRLAEWIPKMMAMAGDELQALPGVSPSRAHQIVPGALVAEAAMDIFGLAELEICPWALREGVILERIDRISRSG